MPEPVAGNIRAECCALSRYLAGIDPDDAVIIAYGRGLHSDAYLDAERDSRLDRLLLASAARSPRLAGLADAYARFASPAGPLRRRLVLLIAILESTAPSYEAFEPAAGGRAGAFAGVVAAGFGFLFRLLAGVLMFALPHLWFRMRAGAPAVDRS